MTERRIRRSADPAEALRYQIDHVRSEARLDALVLADEQGMEVASSGEHDLCTELAAIAPLYTMATRMPSSTLLGEVDIAVRAVRAHGQWLFLASVGGTVARDALLANSARGVQRILALN